MRIKQKKSFLKKIDYPIFYIAYGSNLNKNRMKKRCPHALPLEKNHIRGFRLLFRSVATIVIDKKSILPCGIWEITEKCEAALDRYEGYPDMYRKEYWEGSVNGKKYPVLIYIMNKEVRSIAPPHPVYFERIKNGYKDFDLPLKYLRDHDQLKFFF